MFSEKQQGKKKLRAVIIGCGNVAGGYDENGDPDVVNTHAKAYQMGTNIDLIAVSDMVLQKAEKFCSIWHIPSYYRDATEMLTKEKPEIVSICTPTVTHADLLMLCLEHKCVQAVWCEKPITDNITRAEEIVNLYAKKNIVLAVNYSRRWDEKMLQIKTAIQNKEIGSIQKVVVYYTKGFLNNGSHAIDLLLDWFGKPDEIKTLRVQTCNSIADPTVDVYMVFDNTPVYLIGLDEIEYNIFEIHIIGKKGRIDIQSGIQIEWYKMSSDPNSQGEHKLVRDKRYFTLNDSNAMIVAVNEIAQVAVQGGSVRSSGESALDGLRLCYQIINRDINDC